MKVVRPSEFVWCGIYFVPGKTDVFLRSEKFISEFIDKLNTFSLVRNSDPSFTLDAVMQGESQIVLDRTTEDARVRACSKRQHELEDEQAFLKPDTDCVGPRFIQMVFGDIEFLLTASRELRSDDGWPSTLSNDIEEVIGLVTMEKNILCFIRPHIFEPFLISMRNQPAGNEEHKQYLQ